MDITIRSFEESDFGRLTTLMPPEWTFPGCTPRESQAQATMDFSGMLSACNVRLVATAPATDGGRTQAIVGALFARCAGDGLPEDADCWTGAWECACPVLAGGSPAACDALRYEKQLGERGDLLIAQAGDERRYDSELELFVVAPDARGAGVGGALMREFHKILADRGERGFWLQTDSTCSWEWYEKHGYTRVEIGRAHV